MHKSRVEAFSDGVFAIMITIMVLEIRPPEGAELSALQPVLPVFLSYTLSFVFLGIYWNNHHHLLQAAQRVDGRVLWLNLHLLFWLSLIPFATAWMGEHALEQAPIALYGVALWMAGFAYYLLARSLIALHGPDSGLAAALGRDAKGIVSLVLYTSAILLSFVNPVLSMALYVVVAVMWLVPDRRIERTLEDMRKKPPSRSARAAETADRK
jgi:uncharacterized membrane protein